MDHNFMLTDDLLWDYADGLLESEAKLKVDAYLRQNPEQQARLTAIMAEKRAFAALPLDKPNSGFAQNVMAAWAAEQAPAKAAIPAKAKGRDWVLWGMAVIFGLLTALPFLLAPTAAPDGFSLQIPQEYIPQIQVPAFDWAGFLNSALLRNAMLFTIALMGLKLLDKYLLVRNHHIAGH